MKGKNSKIGVASELNSGESFFPSGKKANSWVEEVRQAKLKSAKNPVKIFSKEEIAEFQKKRSG